MADDGHYACEVPAGHPEGLTPEQAERILFALDATLPNGLTRRYVSLSAADIGALQRLVAREAARLREEE